MGKLDNACEPCLVITFKFSDYCVIIFLCIYCPQVGNTINLVAALGISMSFISDGIATIGIVDWGSNIVYLKLSY